MNKTFTSDQTSPITIPDLYQVHISNNIDWEQSDDASSQVKVPFSVKWMPQIEGFFEFIQRYRNITGFSLGGSRKSQYAYTDPTINEVLSVGLDDNRSSLPHRVSLSNFHFGPPITSYGCIYRYVPKDKSPHYLLIQRKDSVSYIDLIHGNYRESQLYFMLQDISLQERLRILESDYDSLWEDLHLKLAEGESYEYGKEIFTKIRPYLEKLFEEVPPTDLLNRNMWLFPKGKINWTEEESRKPESPFECALREFTEETNGLDLTKTKAELVFADPVVERYLGSNSKNYQTDYFVFSEVSTAALPSIEAFDITETSLRKVSMGEVQQAQWVSLEEIKNYLRPERQQIVDYIENNLPLEEISAVSDIWRSPVEFLEPNLENND